MKCDCFRRIYFYFRELSKGSKRHHEAYTTQDQQMLTLLCNNVAKYQQLNIVRFTKRLHVCEPKQEIGKASSRNINEE